MLRRNKKLGNINIENRHVKVNTLNSTYNNLTIEWNTLNVGHLCSNTFNDCIFQNLRTLYVKTSEKSAFRKCTFIDLEDININNCGNTIFESCIFKLDNKSNSNDNTPWASQSIDTGYSSDSDEDVHNSESESENENITNTEDITEIITTEKNKSEIVNTSEIDKISSPQKNNRNGLYLKIAAAAAGFGLISMFYVSGKKRKK